MSDDFEDELLALAGGEESDQEQGIPDDNTRNRSRTSSPSPASPPHPSIEKSASPPRTVPAPKKMAKSTSRGKHDESEEEGEASPPLDSPQSYGSAAMEESDSEGDDAEPVVTASHDPHFYPLEGRFRDAADKARIMAMPEVARERILAEREEEKIKAEQFRSLQGAVMAAETSQIKKRKATVAGFDDGERRATRPKTKRELELEHLKKSRQDAKSGVRRDTANHQQRRSSTPLSQRDAEGESEVEFDDGYRAAPREQTTATTEELQRLRIGREQFAKYSCHPPFEKLTAECFVRVQVADGKYKMAQIKGYEEGKPYKLEPANSKPYYTDQYATLVAGEWSRTFPLTHCSNSRFTIHEIEEWKSASQVAGKRLPNSSWAQKKCEDLHALINFHFDNEDITRKIAKQHKYHHLITAEIEAKKVTKVDVRVEQQRRLAEASRKKRLEADEAIRAANAAKKARQRAAFKEMEAQRVAARKKVEAAQSLQVPKPDLDDLFDGGSDLSRTGTPRPGDRKPEAGIEKKALRETIKGIPTFTRKKMDDEIIGAIDLGIDIEI